MSKKFSLKNKLIINELDPRVLVSLLEDKDNAKIVIERKACDFEIDIYEISEMSLHDIDIKISDDKPKQPTTIINYIGSIWQKIKQ